MSTEMIEELLHQSERLPVNERLILIERLVKNIRRTPAEAWSKESVSSLPQSRWSKLAQQVREEPIPLGDHTDQLKADMQSFREQFAFRHDEP